MIDITWYVKPEGVPVAETAGGVIVRKDGDQVLVALVREGSPGLLYILPKGHVEAGESRELAARREIGEEAGLTDLEYLAELGVYERLNYRRTEWKIIYYFLFRTRQVEAHPTDQNKDYYCDWYPIDQLPPILWPEQKQVITENIDRIIDLLG